MKPAVALMAAFALAALFLAACPTGTGTAPDVAGTYAGDVAYLVPVVGERRAEVILVVKQSGRAVTSHGSVRIAGSPAALVLTIEGRVSPGGDVTVTAQAASENAISEPTCGLYEPGAAELTFDAAAMRFAMKFGTARCGTLRLSGTLARQ